MILEWRQARPSDVGSLQIFECTTPAKRLRTPPYGYDHPRPWEMQVQSFIRAMRPARPRGEQLWIGLDGEGIGGVLSFEEEAGPSHIFVKLLGVSLRHRNNGGGVADEAIGLLVDEVTSRSIAAGVTSSIITGRVDRRNRASQALMRRNGFRHMANEEGYQVWQAVLDYPVDVFQEILPDFP